VIATAEALPMTRERFRGRLDRLVSSFGAIWCHQANEHGERIVGSKSKLYLIDPLLARESSQRRTSPICQATSGLFQHRSLRCW
jgi:hypothetical protein